MRTLGRILGIVIILMTMMLCVCCAFSQSSGNTPPPPPVCGSTNAGALYTDTGTSPDTVYTCSYYNLAWQWVVNPSYGGLVYYPTVPATCEGALPAFLAGWPNTNMYVCVNGFPELISSEGGINHIPFCTGFSPTEGQTVEWTALSTPNPCWTAATGGGSGTSLTTTGNPGPATLVGGVLNIPTGVNWFGTGNSNVGGSLPTSASGIQNTAVGNGALANLTSGNGNVAVGLAAGHNLTTGYQNVAIGPSALFQETTGTTNVAIGPGALSNQNGASDNIAIGQATLDSVTTGDDNVGMGDNDLMDVTTGSGNTAIGHQAGEIITTGNFNLYLGDGASPNIGGTNNEFETVIGGTNGHGSNTQTLGISTQSTYIPGLAPSSGGPDCLQIATTGQITNTGSGCGAGAGTVTSFAAPSGSWPSWLVPTVTNPTTTPSLAVAAGIVPTANGGTGATTAAGALVNLGTEQIAQGGTGATSFTPNRLIQSGSTPTSPLQASNIVFNPLAASVTTVNSVSLPHLMRVLEGYSQGLQPAIEIFSFGSSVLCGATLPNPTTQNPGAYFAASLQNAVDPWNTYNWQFTNFCQNGSVAYGFNLSTTAGYTYTAWQEVLNAGVTPDICLFGYGMNDGQIAEWNSGQTRPGFQTAMNNAVQICKAAGADVVVMTTPHPSVATLNAAGAGFWTLPTSIDQTYPTFIAKPVAASASDPAYPGTGNNTAVVTADSIGNGGPSVMVDRRFLMINQDMRSIAQTWKVPLIDVEKYAVRCNQAQIIATGNQIAAEAVLFDTGQTVHPNLAYDTCSYYAAIDNFTTGVGKQVSQGGVSNDVWGYMGVNVTTPASAVLDLRPPAGDTTKDPLHVSTTTGLVWSVDKSTGDLVGNGWRFSNGVSCQIISTNVNISWQPGVGSIEYCWQYNLGAGSTITIPVPNDSSGKVRVTAVNNNGPTQSQEINYSANFGGVCSGVVSNIGGTSNFTLATSTSNLNVVVTNTLANTDYTYKIEVESTGDTLTGSLTCSGGGGGACMTPQQVVVSSATPTITFSSIPATCTDLTLTYSGQTTASTLDNVNLTFNGDTSGDYDWYYTYIGGSNSGTASDFCQIGYTGVTGNSFQGQITATIGNYAGSVFNKSLTEQSFLHVAGAGIGQTIGSCDWYKATPVAITSITLTSTDSANFAVGTTVTLRGQ